MPYTNERRFWIDQWNHLYRLTAGIKDCFLSWVQYCSLIYSGHFTFNSNKCKLSLTLNQKVETLLSAADSYSIPHPRIWSSIHSLSFNEQMECNLCMKIRAVFGNLHVYSNQFLFDFVISYNFFILYFVNSKILSFKYGILASFDNQQTIWLKMTDIFSLTIWDLHVGNLGLIHIKYFERSYFSPHSYLLWVTRHLDCTFSCRSVSTVFIFIITQPFSLFISLSSYAILCMTLYVLWFILEGS